MGIAHLQGEPGWGMSVPMWWGELGAPVQVDGGLGWVTCSLTPIQPLRLLGKDVSPLRLACELPCLQTKGDREMVGHRVISDEDRVGVSSGAPAPRPEGEERRAEPPSITHHGAWPPRGAGLELTVLSPLHFLSLSFIFTPLSLCLSGYFVLKHRHFLCSSWEGFSFQLILGGWG